MSHPYAPKEEPKQTPPSNIEAEQSLLGALLYDNRGFERVGDNLTAAHFYEPFHARLYAAIENYVLKGMLADPILLADNFSADPAFQELGGRDYLIDLWDHAPPIANIPDYAKRIYDLAVRRDLIRIGGEIIHTAQAADEEMSAAQQIEAAERELFLTAKSKTTVGLEDFSSVLSRSVETAINAFAREGEMAGLSTGLVDLDKKLGGLRPENLIILAARPSMGKTALATNIAFHVAKNYEFETGADGFRKTTKGGVVAFFSLEMSSEELGLRILADVAGISSDRMTKGDLDINELSRLRDVAVEIQAAPLYMDGTGAISIANLTTRARRLQRTVGLDLVVVDYLQLVTTGGGGRHQSPQERVSEITQGLKKLAKDLGVPVVALAQLSRAVENREDKKPMLADLRDSGSIEQDADVVLFVYREAYYLERAQPKEGSIEHMAWEEQLERAKGEADVIIGKQRHGSIGTVKVSFNGEITKFGNLAPRYYAKADDAT